MSVEAAYVGNKGTHIFAGYGPAFNINQAGGRLTRRRSQNRNARRPLFNKFGWTQGIDFFCNCADNATTRSRPRRRSGSRTAIRSWRITPGSERANSGEYFIFDAKLNRGPAERDRSHNFVFSQV